MSHFSSCPRSCLGLRLDQNILVNNGLPQWQIGGGREHWDVTFELDTFRWNLSSSWAPVLKKKCGKGFLSCAPTGAFQKNQGCLNRFEIFWDSFAFLHPEMLWSIFTWPSMRTQTSQFFNVSILVSFQVSFRVFFWICFPEFLAKGRRSVPRHGSQLSTTARNRPRRPCKNWPQKCLSMTCFDAGLSELRRTESLHLKRAAFWTCPKACPGPSWVPRAFPKVPCSECLPRALPQKSHSTVTSTAKGVRAQASWWECCFVLFQRCRAMTVLPETKSVIQKCPSNSVAQCNTCPSKSVPPRSVPQDLREW